MSMSTYVHTLHNILPHVDFVVRLSLQILLCIFKPFTASKLLHNNLLNKMQLQNICASGLLDNVCEWLGHEGAT